VPATICFRYSPSGRIQCVAIDSTRIPSSVLLTRGEQVDFTVRAKGYQPYAGKLIDGEPEAALHQIRLLMINNVLVASYDLPTDLKLDHLEFQHVRNKKIAVYGFTPMASLGRNSFTPGEAYRFIATASNGQIVADETFRMKPGWSFIQFHLKRPEPTSLMSSDLAKPTYFDSAVLYFDQSEYALRKEVKDKLDSISWQMIKSRPLRALVT
jgi:hypothetical protein